jgi:two-component system chemotaxis response regulator CheB
LAGEQNSKRIRVLIVDDSIVVREAMRHAVESDPDLEVAGIAENGREAIERTLALAPDVIAMDFHMPDMNGIQATRRIMEEKPTPIVIVSGLLDPREASANFMALDAGALALLEKPRFTGPEQQRALAEIAQTLKLMSEVSVVRRWRRTAGGKPGIAVATPKEITPPKRGPFSMVVMGASTGGPQAIAGILSRLPGDFCLPILVVQHIAPGFLPGLVHWLDSQTGLAVCIAENGHRPLPGHVYFAPDGLHLGLGPSKQLRLSDDPPQNSLKPSVGHLFRSAADVLGEHGIGILLTGMGHDGAAELGAMRGRGALTIAQSEASCIVFGMPRAAQDAAAADVLLAPDEIASMFTTLHHMTNACGQ